MAYLLGYLFADGNIEIAKHRGRYLRATSTDRSIIQHLKQSLASQHTIKITAGQGTTQAQYFIRIGNTYLVNSLIARGLTPAKSNTMLFPYVPEEYLPDFVRGYFDGDGCVYIEFGQGVQQARILKRLSIVFTCGSSRFLESLSEKLHKSVAVTKAPPFTNERAHRLRFNTEDSVNLFTFMYTSATSDVFFLKRKYDTFIQYFERSTKYSFRHGNVTKAQW